MRYVILSIDKTIIPDKRTAYQHQTKCSHKMLIQLISQCLATIKKWPVNDLQAACVHYWLLKIGFSSRAKKQTPHLHSHAASFLLPHWQ